MKKVLLLAAIIFIFGLCGCEGKTEKVSSIEKYKTVAQEYIEKGDIETAKKALEEGISLTNDESLKVILEEITTGKNEIVTNEKENNPKQDTEKQNLDKDENDSKGVENKEISIEEIETQQESNATQEEQFNPFTVAGVYCHSEYPDNQVVILDYSNSKITFAICSVSPRYIAGAMGKKDLIDGVCEFNYRDTQGNIGKGKLMLGDGKLSLEMSTTQYAGMHSVDAAKGKYNRTGDVPSDSTIYEYCDGGIIY